MTHSNNDNEKNIILPSPAKTYEADQIAVLQGLEAVRKRPGMYIGSTGPNGLHHLLLEVLDNSIDEVLSSHASLIQLIIHEDNSFTVIDNGRGIPTGIHPITGVSVLETVLTVLHSGGKFYNDNLNGAYKVSGGLHGVGVSVVNALSERVEVRVVRGKKGYSMGFCRGERVGNLVTEEIKNNNDVVINLGEEELRFPTISGTSVRVLPDIDVFKGVDGQPSIVLDMHRILERLDELAYLVPGLVLTLEDRKKSTYFSLIDKLKMMNETVNLTKNMEVFRHIGGLEEYIDHLCVGKKALFGDKNDKLKKKNDKVQNKSDHFMHKNVDAYDPLARLISSDGSTILLSSPIYDNKSVYVNAALRWSSDVYSESILSFVNNIRTKDGGTHVEGLKAGLTRCVNVGSKRRLNGKGNDHEEVLNLKGEFIREGLTGIICVQVRDPEFEGQTKGRLGNSDVRHIVDSIVTSELTKLFDFRPDILDAVIKNADNAQSATMAARAARNIVRSKTFLTSTVLPGKLADCSSQDSRETEIFIVEGDSAAGSAKQGRDRRTQAVLPLRGKILNFERASLKQVYQNTELQSLIAALGLGINVDEFKDRALRYNKIIIMTDADDDGAHIRVLLLTFFWRYRRELIERGHVYIAQPPLYKITKVSGRNTLEWYAYNQKEKENIIFSQTSQRKSKIIIQRYKGLGEMMPRQLWSTTMNPSHRKLLQITSNDCASTNCVLSMLMGESVGPRKDFISNNAETIDWSNIDI